MAAQQVAGLSANKVIIENIGAKRILGANLLTKGKFPFWVWWIEELSILATWEGNTKESAATSWMGSLGYAVAGTTATRDTLIPFQGQKYYNTDTDLVEYFVDTGWGTTPPTGGSQPSILDGGTTVDLINSTVIYPITAVVNTTGYSITGIGDGRWKQTGVVGQTPSKSPMQLGAGLLNDGNGVQWSLVVEDSVNVKALGAVGDGVTDDTLAFTAAAAHSRFVVVPSESTGYNVSNSVVAGSSMFLFLGSFITTQLVGSATRHDLHGISIHNGQITLERLRAEPEKYTSTGSNEGSKRGIFTDQADPDITASFSDTTCDTTDTDATVTMDSTVLVKAGMPVFGDGIPEGAVVLSVTNSTEFELSIAATATASNVELLFNFGAADWNFNEINCKWVGKRTGTGADGGESSAKVKSLQVNFNGGGADFDLQSSGAIGCGHTHDTDDISIGDKLAINGGVNSTAETLGKIYGASFSFTIGEGGVCPQAIGIETDCFVDDTGNVPVGLGFNAWSGGNSQPTGTYAAYAIGRSGAAGKRGWKTGIILYTNSGNTGQPIETSGNLIEADDDMTLSNLFNLGNVTVTNNILNSPNLLIRGNGNYSPQDGSGLDLVATTSSVAVGTTPANKILVHYEEGAWTPTLSDGANDAALVGSYDVRVGKYTRIGNIVHITCKIDMNSLESVTGNLRIKGLPFNVSGNIQAAVTVGQAVNLSLGVAGNSVASYIENGTDYMSLRVYDSTGGSTAMTATELTSNGVLSLSASYPMS